MIILQRFIYHLSSLQWSICLWTECRTSYRILSLVRKLWRRETLQIFKVWLYFSPKRRIEHSSGVREEGNILTIGKLYQWRHGIIRISQQSRDVSMTTLLTHTVAHSTKPSFRSKTNNQPLKKFLSLALSWTKVVKNWTSF